MIIRQGLALLMLMAPSAIACRDTPEAKASQVREVQAERTKELARRIAAADSNPTNTAPLARWFVPAELKEISGLTLKANGNVLAHNDEVARIFEIDAKSGIVLKHFSLEGAPKGDFEAIAIAGEDVYLLNSNGNLMKFKEGADGEVVAYTKLRTNLGRECEFESMVYEPDGSRLLLACKKVGSKSMKDDLVIYRVPLPFADTARINRAGDSSRASNRHESLEELRAVRHGDRSRHEELRADLVAPEGNRGNHSRRRRGAIGPASARSSAAGGIGDHHGQHHDHQRRGHYQAGSYYSLSLAVKRVLRIVWCTALSILIVACSRDDKPTPPPAEVTPPEIALAGAVVMIGAGDIAVCGSSGDERTARLVDSVLIADSVAKIVSAVFTLGDNAYPVGVEQPQQLFSALFHSVVGCAAHHEADSSLSGESRLRQRQRRAVLRLLRRERRTSGKGYYSYDVGEWHVISLNSELYFSRATPEEAKAQEDWLKEDLSLHTNPCTLALFSPPVVQLRRSRRRRGKCCRSGKSCTMAASI